MAIKQIYVKKSAFGFLLLLKSCQNLMTALRIRNPKKYPQIIKNNFEIWAKNVI